MKRNITNSLVILFLATSVFACKAKKDLVTKTTPAPVAVPTPTVKNGLTEDVLEKLSGSQLRFKTLNIKAKANLAINGRDNDISMNIRMKNNERIWISLTAIAGIEVARALITPDSIHIMNRLEGNYMAKPFNYIHQFANNQIDFGVIQSLLVGNYLTNFVTQDAEFDTKENRATLGGLFRGISYLFNFNASSKVTNTLLRDVNAQQEVRVNYSDFNAVYGQSMPFSVNLNSKADGKSIALQLRYNQVTIDESLDFPFNVPKRFTVKD